MPIILATGGTVRPASRAPPIISLAGRGYGQGRRPDGVLGTEAREARVPSEA